MITRRHGRKRICSLLTVVLSTLTVALSGCSSDKTGNSAGNAGAASSATESANAGDTSKLIVGIPQDIDSLDPHHMTGAGTKEVMFNVFEGLVKPDENGNLNPAVASEYTVSEDNKVYTFTETE